MDLQLPLVDTMATWRTLDAAAKQLGIGRRTLTRWISEGKLTKYTRPGDKHHHVDLDEVKHLLREFRPVPRKEPSKED